MAKALSKYKVVIELSTLLQLCKRRPF